MLVAFHAVEFARASHSRKRDPVSVSVIASAFERFRPTHLGVERSNA